MKKKSSLMCLVLVFMIPVSLWGAGDGGPKLTEQSLDCLIEKIKKEKLEQIVLGPEANFLEIKKAYDQLKKLGAHSFNLSIESQRFIEESDFKKAQNLAKENPNFKPFNFYGEETIQSWSQSAKKIFSLPPFEKFSLHLLLDLHREGLKGGFFAGFEKKRLGLLFKEGLLSEEQFEKLNKRIKKENKSALTLLREEEGLKDLFQDADPSKDFLDHDHLAGTMRFLKDIDNLPLRGFHAWYGLSEQKDNILYKYFTKDEIISIAKNPYGNLQARDSELYPIFNKLGLNFKEWDTKEELDILSPFQVFKVEDNQYLAVGDLGVEEETQADIEKIISDYFKSKEIIENKVDLSEEEKLKELARLAVKVNKDMIFVHPFSDGNGRTIKFVRDYLFLSLGLPVPLRPDTEDMVRSYDESLEYNRRQMIDYINAYIQASGNKE